MGQGQKNFIDQNYIEVKGIAKLEIVPNEIYLTIHIDEKDTKNKESVEVLEKQMFSALKKAGVNLEKQVYNCFACDAGGNALDFVAHMEGLDPNNTSELRKAALAAADTFGIDQALKRPANGRSSRTRRRWSL